MQRIALISPYDEICHPLRYASSLLRARGHETHMVLLKGVQYMSPQLAPPENEREEGGYYGFVSWITPLELTLLTDAVKKADPRFVAINVAPAHFGLAAHITRALRDETRVPVVWCGAAPTLNPEGCIQHADMLCLGECEHTLADLADAFEKGADVALIPGLWSKTGTGVAENGVRPRLGDLDQLPFADFETANKTVICENQLCPPPFPPKSPLYTNFMIRSSRGRPFGGAYYFNGLDDAVHGDDRTLFRRSVKYIIDEMKYRVRNWPAKIQHVEFADSVFPVNPVWCEEFGDEFGSEIGLPFSGYTHPRADKETLPKLCYYGLDYTILGILTGSDRSAEANYGDAPKKAEILSMVSAVREAGIHLVVEVVGHNPLETEEDRKETLKLLCELPKPYGMKKVLPMAFMENTPAMEAARRAGVMDRLERPEGVDAWLAKPDPENVFWEMLHTLAHFKDFTPEHILAFTQDQHMRENPGIFAEFIANMYNATYFGGNPLLEKDEFVGHLRWKISELEKSRMYRAYHKVKTLVR